jgi:hypothetical protein
MLSLIMNLENSKQDEHPIKAYSLKELAGMYHVSKKTLRKWLKPFENEIGVRNGYYYNNAQVKTIFEKVGHPKPFEKRINKKTEE